jgi:predicted O-methyltransferase YrrM
MRRILNKVRDLKQRIVRKLTKTEAAEVKRVFQEACELGKDSPNQWIKRSSQIPGFLFRGEHEFILEQAARAPKGDFVEIGVWFGKSTSLLAGALVERNQNEKVFAFDPFTNEGEEKDRKIHAILHGLKNAFPVFVENAKRLNFYNEVIPVATLSTIAIPVMNLSIAFAFIDGAHDESSVRKDFDLIKNKLLPGAIILFHDAIGEGYPGVIRAIESILRECSEIKRVDQPAGTIVALRHEP